MPSTSLAAAELPSIPLTIGTAFIGFSVSCVLFGVSTNQTLTYFIRYPDDWFVYKLLHARGAEELRRLLNILDQALIGHAVYFYCIMNYNSIYVLFEHKVTPSLILQLTVGSVIGAIVRLCFATRIWRFSQQNILVTSIVVILTLTQFGAAIAFTLKCFQSPFVATLPKLKFIASLALGINVATDVFTACGLAFFLRRFRTGHAQSDSIVNKLTIYAVNTGAVTSACSLGTLLSYDLRRNNFQFLAFYFVLSKRKIFSISRLHSTHRSTISLPDRVSQHAQHEEGRPRQRHRPQPEEYDTGHFRPDHSPPVPLPQSSQSMSLTGRAPTLHWYSEAYGVGSGISNLSARPRPVEGLRLDTKSPISEEDSPVEASSFEAPTPTTPEAAFNPFLGRKSSQSGTRPGQKSFRGEAF
ncbi:unnamed protein product [Mycena citricolor]|uniref:DUF6534 domain-containing protein n=1 Tax=Mycena citricolor TaxID=2018698 RepID=A0AAD2H036_9AGAR|nr:unnamed protein product [Mycena citricolor]